MADIELVIKIPEETYDYWKKHKYEYVFAEAIANGVVLPKGHGALKDANALEDAVCNETHDINCWSSDIERAFNDGIYAIADVLDKMPTIIEADKEEENESVS